MEKKERVKVSMKLNDKLSNFIIFNLLIIGKCILFNYTNFNEIGNLLCISATAILLSSLVFISNKNKIATILLSFFTDTICIAITCFITNNYQLKLSNIFSISNTILILSTIGYAFYTKYCNRTSNIKFLKYSFTLACLLAIINFTNNQFYWFKDAKVSGLLNKMKYETAFNNIKQTTPYHNIFYFCTFYYYKKTNYTDFPDKEISAVEYLDLKDTSKYETALPTFVISTIDNELPSYQKVNLPNFKECTTITNNDYINCQIDLINKGEIILSQNAKIRIRGNSSAILFTKKPFKIKLEEKKNLIKLINPDNKESDKDKEWILLANPTNFNNIVAQSISQTLGIEYQPQTEFVELVFNNCYLGVYQLIQSVDKGTKHKIKIAEDGFIIENDLFWWNSKSYFKSEKGDYFTFKYPKVKKNKKIPQEIVNYYNTCENSLIQGNYQDYIDIESYANYCLCQDLIGALDFDGTNKYFSKYSMSDNSKLKISVVWDTEYSLREHRTGEISKVLLKNMRNTDDYKKLYKSAFSENKISFVSSIKDKIEQLDSIALDKAFENENRRWGTNVHSFSIQKNNTLDFIEEQIKIIEQEIN